MPSPSTGPYTAITPDAAPWDAFVQAHPRAHLLQLSAWGTLKAEFGWRALRVAITHADQPGQIVAGAQMLLRRLPLRLGWLAYIPYGPLVDWAQPEQVRALWSALDAAARRAGAALIKIEPGFDLDGSLAGVNWREQAPGWGLRPSPQTVQPPRTVILDVTGDEDAILKHMNQGTRRNIRKSAKHEVVIRQGTASDVASFNALLAETGERGEFGVHTPAYYQRAYELFVPSGRAALIMASYGGGDLATRDLATRDLAGVMVFALGDWAWYLYGASSQRERQRMASYGVQWAGIQWAREQGARYYDMYGVPDADPDQLEAQFEQRSDGLWGVYRFKRGWGGNTVRSLGAWDRPLNRVLYTLYAWAARRRSV